METKLKNFINKWLNKYLEVVDPTNKNQCFDLVVAWCDELGIPRIFPHLYAYQIFTVDTNDKKKYFDKITNTATAYPLVGDIIVWGKAYNGTAGHTAVATGQHQTQGKSTDWFEAFSQNDPLNLPCVLKKYSYKNVLGWLRPKKEMIKLDSYYNNCLQSIGIDLNNLESVKVCIDTWHEVAEAGLYIKKDEHQRIVNEKETTIQNLNQQISQLIAKLNKAREEKEMLAKEIEDCYSNLNLIKEQYNKINQELIAERDKVVYLEKLKDEWQIKEGDYIRKIKTLETQIENLKKPAKQLLIEILKRLGVK